MNSVKCQIFFGGISHYTAHKRMINVSIVINCDNKKYLTEGLRPLCIHIDWMYCIKVKHGVYIKVFPTIIFWNLNANIAIIACMLPFCRMVFKSLIQPQLIDTLLSSRGGRQRGRDFQIMKIELECKTWQICVQDRVSEHRPIISLNRTTWRTMMGDDGQI